jgi:hypothetical protein
MANGLWQIGNGAYPDSGAAFVATAFRRTLRYAIKRNRARHIAVPGPVGNALVFEGSGGGQPARRRRSICQPLQATPANAMT